MKVFCYFVEPSSYTVDLVENVYLKLKIPFIFIKDRSIARSTKDIKCYSFLSHFYLLKRIKFIFDICRNHDLIIINGYNNYVFILTFFYNMLLIKKKYIAIESDTQLRVPSNFIKRFLKWSYLNFIFRRSYVLGFSGGTKTHKDLFRYYGMNENRIFLMPMLVDNKRFLKNTNTKQIPFIFLYVGRIVKRKNVEALIQCFISKFSNEHAELHIVGDGVELEAIKNKYIHHNINYRGELFGDDLVRVFHRASVFVLPSLVEPWGLVVNEALSSGLPVIIRKEVGAAFDLLYNRNTGYIVSNNKEMADRMLTLYRDPKLRAKFSSNAVKLMQNHWNYDLYLSCLNNVIEMFHGNK